MLNAVNKHFNKTIYSHILSIWNISQQFSLSFGKYPLKSLKYLSIYNIEPTQKTAAVTFWRAHFCMRFYWIYHPTFHFHEWRFCIYLLILLCLQVMSEALLCSSFQFLLNAVPVLTNTMIHFCCLFASQRTISPQPMDKITYVLDHICLFLIFFLFIKTFTSSLFANNNIVGYFFWLYSPNIKWNMKFTCA